MPLSLSSRFRLNYLLAQHLFDVDVVVLVVVVVVVVVRVCVCVCGGGVLARHFLNGMLTVPHKYPGY